MACSTIADLTRPSRIRPETSDEKSSRQSGADPVDDAWRRLQYPLDQHLCIGSEMALLCHGVEMAPLDVLEPVMLVLAGKRHRQLAVVQRELIRLFAFHRPDRHHVVDRREPVAAFRQQRDAEILRMAVRGAEHPEQQLHGDERAQVFFRVYRKTQHVRQAEHSGATVGLVLEMRRLAERLAEILLRQAQQPVAGRMHPAVETLDRQHRLGAELEHGRARNRNAVFLQDVQA